MRVKDIRGDAAANSFKMNSKADIIIVNWNSGRDLAECVDSIRLFGGNCLGKVIIVDNGSTDHSLDINGSNLTLDVICARENLGFAKAGNLGASHSASRYILFLNPDARLLKGTLDKAINFVDSDAAVRVGVCGVRLLDDDGKTQRHSARFPSASNYFNLALGLNHLSPKYFPTHRMMEFDHLTSRTVDHVIGAFYLVRRSLFVALGGFDERFFVYLEDLDFSLRAKQEGWRAWYLADAVALHRGGGSSQGVKAARLFYSILSRMLYAIKHFSRVQAFGVIVLALFVEPISRLVRATLNGSGQEVVHTIEGYLMILKNLPMLWRRSPKHRDEESHIA